MKNNYVYVSYQIDTIKLRNFCIKHNLYTRGTNDDYSNMFDMCHKYNETPVQIMDNLLNPICDVFTDILNHSNQNAINELMYDGNCTYSDIFATFMNYCVDTLFWDK